MLNVKRYVNSVLSSNTFLMWEDGKKTCWLVDCGDTFQILNDLKRRNLCLEGILLTHTHFDHIYGLNEMISAFPHVVIYTTSFGYDALISAKLNLSRYTGNCFELSHRGNVKVLSEDDVSLKLLGKDMTIYHVPGHDPSCLAYQLGKYLFTGDAYIPHVKVVTNLPRADKILAVRNYKFLLEKSFDLIVCAGHGSDN